MDNTNLSDLYRCWLSPTGRVVVEHPNIWDMNAYHESLAQGILADIWKLKLDDYDDGQTVFNMLREN